MQNTLPWCMANNSMNYEDKAKFVTKVSPLIKNGMFFIFLCLIFPSTVEVTSSRDHHLLVSFGLMINKCPLANLVFDTVFSSCDGTATTLINVADDSSSCPLSTTVAMNQHPFSTPFMGEELSFNIGVSSFAPVKAFNTSWNTYTMLIHEVVSKLFSLHYACLPFLLCILQFTLFLSFILYRRFVQEA
jgi:hypothetical protein